jgi:peptidoglycan/LPS O-acetylase OafA/YrhL
VAPLLTGSTTDLAADPVERGEAPRPYLRELNLIRWLTSIGVVATHCVEEFATSGGTLYGGVLSGLHATREVFFVLSALVLTYRYYGRRPFPWREFYLRRVSWVLVPYLVWTGVYFAVSYPHVGGFSLVQPTGSWTHQAGQLGSGVVQGIGHLYYVAVLLQFLVVFPLLVWCLRRTARFHLLVVIASVVVQVWLMRHVSQTPSTNRDLDNYQVYLVVGAVAGAHFEQVARRLWERRGIVAALVLAVLVGTEVLTVSGIRGGTAESMAADPFQARFIAFNFAVFVGLYLLGAWWFARPRSPRATDLILAGADNSFGVYLSQGIPINVLLCWGWRAHLEPELNPVLTVLLAAVVVWLSAALLSSALARTPLARVVGRARRPWSGGPAAGRFEPLDAGCQPNLSPS